MRPKTLLIIFFVFVAVVSFYVVFEKVYLPRHEKEKEKEDRIFTLEREALDIIKITTKTSNIVLVRDKKSERWMMTAPIETETDAGEVESFIASALDARIARSLGTKAELEGDMGEFGLTEPRLVVVLGSGEESEVLFLGNAVPSGEEVYAARKGDDRVFLVDAFVFDDLAKDETTLRDKRLVALAVDNIVEFSVTRDGKTVAVKKDADGAWMITEPIEARADPDQVEDILDFIADESARSFAGENADRRAYGLDPPTIAVTLVDKDGATSGLAIGKAAGDGLFWAVREGKPWIFTVPETVKNKLTVSAEFIMDKALFSYRVADVTALTVATAEGTLSVVRDGDGYKITKPEELKGDKNAIDNLLLDLKDLKLDKIVKKPAGSLAAYGLDAPTVAVTVTYGADDKEHTAELSLKKGGGAESYGYLSTGDLVFSIPTEAIAPISPSLFSLKDKALLGFSPDEVKAVTIVKDESTFGFKKRTLGKDRWKMTEPESTGVEAGSMKSLLTGIGELSYSGVLADNKDSLSPWGLDKPEMTITVVGSGDKEIGTIRIGGEKGDEAERYMPAVSSSLDGVYKIDAGALSDIMSDVETIQKGR